MGYEIQNTDRGANLSTEQLLSLLVHKSAAAVGVKDLDGRYLLLNDKLKQFAETPDTTGQDIRDDDLFVATVARRIGSAAHRLQAENVAITEEVDLTIDGAATPYLVVQFPIFESDQETVAVGMVAVPADGDQSRLSEMKQALQRSDAINAELRGLIENLELHASTDRLTGAWNRSWLDEALLNELSRFERYGHPVSILIIDVDHFKQVNDRFGHSAGDKVLVELARRVRASDRGSDSLIRWGGEEFVVLCPNTPLSAARRFGERLRLAIADPPFASVGQVSCSIGAAQYLQDETWKQWFDRADQALYRAKQSGRNKVEIALDTGNEVENVGGHCIQLVWHKGYNCNEPTIDAQHRELFQLANELLGLVLASSPRDELLEAAQELVSKLRQHFRDEENIIRAAGYPMTDAHARIHQQLLEKSDEMMQKFCAQVVGVGELFDFLGHELLSKHLLNADRLFFDYVGND